MIFEISAEEISALEAVPFVDFVNHLISASASRLGIPPTCVKTNSYTTGAEGGVDGRVEDKEGRADGRWFPRGLSIWQFKTDKSGKNATSQKLKKEARKPRVQEALCEGAWYHVAVARICDDKMRRGREKVLREALQVQNFDPCRVTLLTADDLAKWASEHPPLLLLPYFHRPIGKCLRIEHWERQELHQGEFVPDKSRSEILEEIRKFISRGGSPVHLRVEGRRGVGKTRLVMEALKEQRIRERALYAQEPNDIPGEFWAWLRDKTTASVILVVDECDEDEGDRLKQQADACEGRVRLITIGVGEAFFAEVAPNRFFLEHLDDESVRKLLEARFPTLTYNQTAWITRLTAGYVRLAVACAEAVAKKPDIDVAQLTLTPDVRHVLQLLVPVPRERKVMQGLSLLTRVGIEGDVAQEGKALAEFVSVDWHDFCTVTEEMHRRGLVGKKGRNRYVTPDLLAAWLSAEVWTARRDELVQLIPRLPEGSRKSFLERLKDLGAHEKAQEVVRQLLSEQGLFRDIDSLDNEEGSRLLHTLALADTVSAFRVLERFFMCASVDRLRSFSKGRRWVVWTLVYLKWFRDTFFGAARLLLTLAEAENETLAKNATGVWTELFQLRLGGTEVPAIERHRLIEEALASEQKEVRILAVKGIGASLRSDENRSSGIEHHGVRPVPPEWYPKTWDEVWEVFRSALRLLDMAFQDRDVTVAKEAQSTLLESAHSVVHIGLADEVLNRFESFKAVDDSQRRALRETIEGILEYEREALNQEQRERFAKLSDKFVGTTFRERLRRWVGEWSFGDFFRYRADTYQRPEEEAAKLADETFLSPELLRQELDWLSSDEARNVGYFGKRLGELDVKREWLPSLVQRVRQGRGLTLLSTYLWGRREAGDEQWSEALLDRWADEEPALALTLLETTRRSQPEASGVQRLVRLVEKGWLEPSRLGMLMWGDWVKNLPSESFCDILRLLMNDEGEKATESALAMLRQRLEAHPEEHEKLSTLAWKLIERPTAIKGHRMLSYHWHQVAKFYTPDKPVHIAKTILALYENGETLHTDAPLQVLKEATHVDFNGVWEEVAKLLLKGGRTSFQLIWRLKDWNVRSLDIDYLLEWAEQNKPDGPRILAALSPVEGVPLTRLPRELLVRYGDDEYISSRLYDNFVSGSFAGSMAKWHQTKLEIARKWLDDLHPNVRRWAQKVVERLENALVAIQRKEEEEYLDL